MDGNGGFRADPQADAAPGAKMAHSAAGGPAGGRPASGSPARRPLSHCGRGALARRDPPHPPAVWYVQVLVISAPLTVAYAAASGVRLRPGAVEPSIGVIEPERGRRLPANDANSFLGRLPGRVGREVVALQMEDHYVRVHTAEGSALVLVPLHQAIAELSGLPGVKVHRSWWVVRGAVTGSVRDGRNVRLRLSNGLEAPVSRTCLPHAKAAGLVS